MRQKLTLPIALLCLLALTACKTTLDPAGPYQGDKVLYNADVAIATSYDIIHTFVQWELEHRAALAGTPEVKQVADSIRQRAPQAFRSAITLRDAYAIAPNDTTHVALSQALAVIHSLVREAMKYNAEYKTLP